MLDMKEKSFLEIFSFDHLQIAAPIIAALDSYGISADEFADIYKEVLRIKMQEAKKETNGKMSVRTKFKCPECGYPLGRVVSGDRHIIILGCKKCRFSTIARS